MMSSERRARLEPGKKPADRIVHPGRNCWRIERAHRFVAVQDAAEYFRLVREALLGARQTVFILGWDILASVDLLPAGSGQRAQERGQHGPAADAPTRLGELLDFIARRRPRLRCYILIWDYASLYALERDPFSRWRLGWRTPRHVTFGFDDRHPAGASHHQKIVVVDDQLAFCGGIDLTGHRWDTSTHRLDEPARVTPVGDSYGPYHDVQAMVTGPVAASLGMLARERWRALGERKLPVLAGASHDLWPASIEPDLTDVDVAIARTIPGSQRHPAVRECETLFLDSIAHAQRAIYIESQYFTNDTIAAALAARLRDAHGPEIIVVTPTECSGWLERNTMGMFRDDVFRQLSAADQFKRLRLVMPMASQSRHVPVFVHSKVMVVDDRLVRIGSANISRRSMGVDTECDLAIDAGDDARIRGGIRRIRDRLLAEHLALPPAAVAGGIDRFGSMRAFIDTRGRADHTLAAVQLPAEHESKAPEALRAAADPEEPIWFGTSVTELVPPVDATNELRPLRIRIMPAVTITIAIVAASSFLIRHPEFRAIQDALRDIPDVGSSAAIGAFVFMLATLALVPLEVAALGAGLIFGAPQGAVVALAGSLVAAAIGYAAGRAIGGEGLTRWVSRRAYRSGRQLSGHGVIGIVVLRLASVANAGSIHLLCGAGHVPFGAYMIGTLIGLSPVLAVLTLVGALIRLTVLDPSLVNAAITIAATVLFSAVAAAVRTVVLTRQFAPSVSKQRARAQFG